MPYAKVGDLVMRFRVTGSGPPLLLIRGLVRSLDYWGGLESILARNFTTIVFDNRGVGGSDVTRPPYTTSMMADDAAGLLEALDIPKAHVFAISLGGMIAQKLALRHPNQVDGLVLGCTTPGMRLGVHIPWKVIGKILAAPLLPEEEVHGFTASFALSRAFLERHPEVIDQWRELSERWPVSRIGFLGQFAAAATHDMTREQLGRIRARTLLLHGDADQLIPFENSRRLEKLIPGAKLVPVHGAGHDFPVEQPETTARLIGEFLLPEG